MNALLIPVKDPARAKTRLGELLSADERAALVWAMFEDLRRAVGQTTLAERIVLVSSYAPALAEARALGWEVLIEEAQISESASVDWASQKLAEQGCDGVLRLPADVPLIRGADIDELLAVPLIAPAVLLVPSRDGTGTNAILRTPPDLFPSHFGPNSLALHKAEAAGVGARCALVENERIALDIDEPSDVTALLARGHGTQAYNLLTTIQRRNRE